jgi:hypothetical protein
MIWTCFTKDQRHNPKEGSNAQTEIKSPNRKTEIRMATTDYKNVTENEERTQKENEGEQL